MFKNTKVIGLIALVVLVLASMSALKNSDSNLEGRVNKVTPQVTPSANANLSDLTVSNLSLNSDGSLVGQFKNNGQSFGQTYRLWMWADNCNTKTKRIENDEFLATYFHFTDLRNQNGAANPVLIGAGDVAYWKTKGAGVTVCLDQSPNGVSANCGNNNTPTNAVPESNESNNCMTRTWSQLESGSAAIAR